MPVSLDVQSIRATIKQRIKVLEFAANQAKQNALDSTSSLDMTAYYVQTAQVYQNQASELWRILGTLEKLAEQKGIGYVTGMPDWLHALVRFCSDYHSGQGSRGYKLLCRSMRKCAKLGVKNPLDVPMNEEAAYIYAELEQKYQNKV